MPPKRSREDHEKAWEVYYETRNFREVERVVGIAWITAAEWAKSEYKCSYGCPFHDYKKLSEERNRALYTSLKLVEGKKNPDPKDIDGAIDQSTELAPITNEQIKVLKGIVKSDIERLQHLEFLYGKIFFDLTGIALETPMDTEVDGHKIEAKDFYRTGLHVRNLESGTQALLTLINKINDLKGNVKSITPPDDKLNPKPQLSIDKLREFRALLENTPLERLETLGTIARPVENGSKETVRATGEGTTSGTLSDDRPEREVSQPTED